MCLTSRLTRARPVRHVWGASPAVPPTLSEQLVVVVRGTFFRGAQGRENRVTVIMDAIESIKCAS